MDDLISRKAALELLGEPHPLDHNAIADVQKIIALPSVPAVPLEPLCEWLALRFGYPCQIIDDCNAWYVSECAESEAKKADCWRRVLTKWMEGLDADN